MAEAHFIGQIVGATGFEERNLFCRWGIVAGSGWRKLEGDEHGRTQIDHPQDEEMALWAHPVDVHYATSTISGWPRIHFQVWSEDIFGRKELAGYGFSFLPTVAGEFSLECVTWRPAADKWAAGAQSFFLGGAPHLVHDELVYTHADRFRLFAETTGTVHIELGIVLKDFEKNGVETFSSIACNDSAPEAEERIRQKLAL